MWTVRIYCKTHVINHWIPRAPSIVVYLSEVVFFFLYINKGECDSPRAWQTSCRPIQSAAAVTRCPTGWLSIGLQSTWSQKLLSSRSHVLKPLKGSQLHRNRPQKTNRRNSTEPLTNYRSPDIQTTASRVGVRSCRLRCRSHTFTR